MTTYMTPTELADVRGTIDLITRIADRAREFLPEDRPMMHTMMDIEAVHEACPLKLRELLEADDGNFAHDVCGIYRHLNRETKQLEDCFVPRFAEQNT